MADAVIAFDNLVDRRLPLKDEDSQTYFTLSGLWIAGGAWAGEATIQWLEKGGGSKLEVIAAIGATSFAALTGGALWRQGWRAKGEA